MAGFAVVTAAQNQNWQSQMLSAHPGENARPIPFWDAVQTSYDDTVRTRNADVLRNNYGARVNAMANQYQQVTGRPMPIMGETTGWASRGWEPEDQVPDAAYDNWVAEQKQADPRLGFLKTTGDLRNDVTAELSPVRTAADQGAATHPIAATLGSAAGGLTDPENLMMMAGTAGFGLEGTGAKVIAGRIMAQGAIGAGMMGIQVPGKIADAQEYGGPGYTGRDALGDVAGGFVGGAVLEGAGIGVAHGAGWLWRNHVAPHIATGAEVDPAVRGAGQQLDLSDIGDQAAGSAAMPAESDEAGHALSIGAEKPDIEPEKNIENLFAENPKTASSYQNVALAGQNRAPALDGAISAPPVVTSPPLISGATEYQGRAIWSGQFDPMQLETDAANFQYKAEADRQGVTARLQGVQAWDPASSGKSLIWEDSDGRQFVADGHQRRGLARRLIDQGFASSEPGQRPMLDGMLFREADGWSARDVRVVAALKNIREGSGTILDAAKVFRDAPGSAADRSLPVTGDFIQQARSLARLEPEAFGAVINKVIPERYGAEIGRGAPTRPDLHMAMVRLMKEADPSSIEEARALVSEALLDEQVASEGIQPDLFGGIAPQMTTIARAKVKASVMSALARDARVYGQLVKNADIIEAGGNALARTENEQRLSLDLAAREIVNRLSLRSGPVGEAFAAAAKRVAEGARAGDVSKAITASIKQAVADGELEALTRAADLAPEVPPPPVDLKPEAQIAPKGEDVRLEAPFAEDEAQGGLFDDILADPANKDAPFEAALKRLGPCAPGGE